MPKDIAVYPPTSSPASLDLAHLLLACGSGNTRAFALLHQRVRQDLRRHAMRLTIRHDMVDDIVQESLIAIWRQSATFRPEQASPMTWMQAIVRHKTFDHFRALRTSDRLHATYADACALDPDNAGSPCGAVETRQRAAHLGHCMEQLFTEQRLAIRLVYLHELTHAEAASHMRKPLGTIKTWIRRGMLDLRRSCTATSGAPVPLSAEARPCVQGNKSGTNRPASA